MQIMDDVDVDVLICVECGYVVDDDDMSWSEPHWVAEDVYHEKCYPLCKTPDGE